MKEETTKEKILKALEDKKPKKVKYAVITQKMCDEMNEMAKEMGLDKYPGWKPHKPGKIRYLFG